MLVGRVRKATRIAHSTDDDRSMQVFKECGIRATSTIQRGYHRLLTVDGTSRFDGKLNIGIVGIDGPSFPAAWFNNHFDVIESLGIQMRAQLVHDALGVLLRRQTKINLAACLCRDDGL